MTLATNPSNHKYFYHVEETGNPARRTERFLAAFAAILEHSNYRFLLDLYAQSSARCGRCSVACQVFQASQDPRDVPCYRTKLLLDVYRAHFLPAGRLFTHLRRVPALSEAKLDEIIELFYRCTACRRCKLECPLGIDHALLTHLGRYILSESGLAPRGLAVSVREQLEGATGNTSAIPLPALLDNLEFLEGELLEMTGEQIRFPVDRMDADYIFFPAVSDYLMEADTLMGIAAVLHAAGVSWTIGSGYYDGINYGLFYDDYLLERILGKLVGEARRLRAKVILIGECGHAARSAHEFIPAFFPDQAPPVVSILELTAQLVAEGKLQLEAGAVAERITYHDPCNIARSGWVVEQPRRVLGRLAPNFTEMRDHGRSAYCCGGGGGLVSLDETHDFRMNVVGATKAAQIAETGAEIVATPCANCKKQLRELVAYHKIPVEVVGVHDLVLRAIRFPQRQPDRPAEAGVQEG